MWLLTLACLAVGPLASEVSETDTTVELFTRGSCPHCADAESFLKALASERLHLVVRVWATDVDPAARARLSSLAHAYEVEVRGLPAIHVRGRLLFGFDQAETTGARILQLIEGDVPPPANDATCEVEGPCEPDGRLDVPLLGEVSARRLGLPLFTVVLGLLDGFNPCAMWVLLFLLSLLVNLESRARMALIAGIFVGVSGLTYFAFMAAWLNVFLLIGLSRAVQVGLALVALVVGGLNVKEYFAFGVGLSLSIPAAAKPGIYARTRAILRAENIGGAVGAVVVLALLVNAVELLCTAGLPALYTHVLAGSAVPGLARYAYLLLYNVAYMLDDALMVAVAVVTLSRERLQKRAGRWLKLLSGAIMLLLGLVMLLRPQWLAALG